MAANKEKIDLDAKINFREYHRVDLPDCSQIGVNVFPIYRNRFTGEEINKVMKAHIDSCYTVSTYYELAIMDGKVVGILFGQIKRNFNLINFLKQLLLIAVRYLRGKYGSRKKLIKFLKPCIQEAKVLGKNIPPSEGEIVLFAVAPISQGKGIGRTLMDRFVYHASMHGISNLSVPTDEIASFWFYERYGFRKWAEYKDPLASYCAGKPITGFSYQLVLQKKIKV